MPSPSPKSRSPRRQSRTRVALVDEFPVFSEALGVVISREDDLEFVGSATDPTEAIALVQDLAVDVCVVDIDVSGLEQPNQDGIDIVGSIKTACPETRVLILAGRMDVDTMARAASEGACGFLPKTSTLEEICRAIRTAKDGGMFVERALIVPLIDRLSRGRAIAGGSSRADITPREHEVLTLLGEGLDVTTISKRMGISINTCRGHVKNLLIKFGAHSQLEAVVEAVHQGLLPHLSR
jgi:DNA-binding NarL/FixJ family response regulator